MEGLEVGLFLGGRERVGVLVFGVFFVGKGYDDGDEAWGLGMGRGERRRTRIHAYSKICHYSREEDLKTAVDACESDNLGNRKSLFGRCCFISGGSVGEKRRFFIFVVVDVIVIIVSSISSIIWQLVRVESMHSFSSSSSSSLSRATMCSMWK